MTSTTGSVASARSPEQSSPRLWPFAIPVGALGAAICFDALPGVNWGIWTTAAAAGLGIVVWRAHGRLAPEVAVLLGLASVLAWAASLTADPLLYPFVLLGTATTLAVATLVGGGVPIERAGARFIALAPFVGGVRAAREAAYRAARGARLVRDDDSGPALRGAMVAVPVVGVLALLLSAADPVFAAVRDDVLRAMSTFTVVPRLVFFVLLTGLALGSYGVALRAAGVGSAEPRTMPDAPRRELFGDTERLIILGSVAGLFALFLILQLSYLFGNVPATAGNGVTYAAYARRGFGELTISATIATALVLWLDRHAVRGPREGTVRLVALVLITFVQLLLDSAFHRVTLYEQAYGFTAARLYAQMYMIVVSLMLVAFGYEIWDDIDIRRLARRAAFLGAVAVASLGYWNHEAWIARRNLARYAATGRLDASYLVRSLSPNAVPAIVSALPTLPPAESAAVRDLLEKRYAGRPAIRATRWYEWSLRRRQAVEALRTIGVE